MIKLEILNSLWKSVEYIAITVFYSNKINF